MIETEVVIHASVMIVMTVEIRAAFAVLA